MMRKIDKKKIHPNLYKSIFRFLPGSEIKKNLRISHEWKAASEELLEQTKNKIYFIVGKPIRFTDPRTSSWQSDIMFNLRKNIPSFEIIQSFPKNSSIRLFKTENEALDYARFLRQGDSFSDEIVTQPGIFKVQFLYKVEEKSFQSEKIEIKDLVDIRAKREKIINFFETQSFNVIPLEGQFKVDPMDRNQFTYYSKVDYKNYAAEQAKNNNRCTIM